MLDDRDTALLRAIQTDATLTAQELAGRLNLSASQVARRRQRLEAGGLVQAYVARLDPGRIGLDVQAFIQIQFVQNARSHAVTFARLCETTDQIVSAWTLTGEADYLLRVYVPTLDALNRLIQDRLLTHPAVARVQSQIVMDHIKQDGPLPVGVLS